MNGRSTARRLAAWPLLGCVALAACQVDVSELGDPSVPGMSRYRHGTGAGEVLPAGNWWKCFRDSELDRLLVRLDEQNPTLAAAIARYDGARAALGLARSDHFPGISGEVVWKRKRDSSSGVFVPPDVNYSEYRAALNLEWEIDLWGRVRQSVNAARAEDQAAAADVAAARLSLQAEAARTYFELRYIDRERELLERSLALRQENLDLVRARVEGGEVTELDQARAETELESVRAQLLQLERSRAEFAHALAVLAGETPASFSLSGGGTGTPPRIPEGVPSSLLERRPDIRAAEERIRAAAARVGVVRASYLPRITLGGIGGVSSLDLDTLLDAGSLFGEIGPDISIPIWQGGQFGSDEERARAEGAEAVALYRETVLQAFREVEDALSGITFLDREIEVHRRAAQAAGRATRLSQKRYEGGLVSFLDVVEAERTELEEQRNLVQALSARHLATVQLVQALGGGWEVAKAVRKE